MAASSRRYSLYCVYVRFPITVYFVRSPASEVDALSSILLVHPVDYTEAYFVTHVAYMCTGDYMIISHIYALYAMCVYNWFLIKSQWFERFSGHYVTTFFV